MTEWLAWAIASGKDYLVKTANDESILHWAVFYENKESVKIICQKGAIGEVETRARSALIQKDLKLLSLIDHLICVASALWK
jgi:ankyrin repeat protein